jgi:sterol 3beta-glucosyltransferase
MSVVVHHGGAGTIGAGFRAGCPTVVIPFFADQPFWGRCVYKAGAGPKTIPQHKLNPETLAHAISAAVYDKTMKQKAMAIRNHICRENGVERAVQLVHRFVQEKKTE